MLLDYHICMYIPCIYIYITKLKKRENDTSLLYIYIAIYIYIYIYFFFSNQLDTMSELIWNSRCKFYSIYIHFSQSGWLSWTTLWQSWVQLRNWQRVSWRSSMQLKRSVLSSQTRLVFSLLLLCVKCFSVSPNSCIYNSSIYWMCSLMYSWCWGAIFTYLFN